MVEQRGSGDGGIEHTFRALTRAWARSDWLFDVVGRKQWVRKGIVLRHPFLFYVGHLPSFAWNHTSAVLGLPSHSEELDALFARGIDPATEAEAHALGDVDWPETSRVEAYRDAVRKRLGEQLPALQRAGRTDRVARELLPLVLEHELMHHETLLYMIRQLPVEDLNTPAEWRPAVEGEAPVANGPRVPVAAGPVQLGVERADLDFGWCNEFPGQTVHVPAFELDRCPVTVAQFVAFVEDGGYADEALWDRGDLAWASEAGLTQPLGWRGQGADRQVRSMCSWHPVASVGGWPVQVSLAEARAYCRWSRSRLPTEAELHRAAFTTPDGGQRAFPWGDEPPGPEHGSLDFVRHGRVPVDSHPAAQSAWGIRQLVGNGWEWTSTPFMPRPGFQAIHPNYPGYSADFFDGDHFVVFGASWATDARLIRRSFRNWYQGRYPYAFTTFRTAREDADPSA